MSDAIEKAARDAVEAADNTDLTRQIVAILAAQQLLNQQQPPAVAQQATAPFDAKKWWTIGGLAIVGAGAASALAIAFALAAVAIAIGATCATACLLILRSMWRDLQKGR